MVFQIADVTKVLAAAGKTTAKQRRIVVDDAPGGAYIGHKPSGNKTPPVKKEQCLRHACLDCVNEKAG